MTRAHACTQFRQYSIHSVMWLPSTNQVNILIFSEMNVKTNQFNLNQRQKTKAYFHIEFDLDVDV